MTMRQTLIYYFVDKVLMKSNKHDRPHSAVNRPKVDFFLENVCKSKKTTTKQKKKKVKQIKTKTKTNETKENK